MLPVLNRRVLLAGVAFALLAGPALAADFPRTLTHAFGQTEIPAEPRRIVALSDIDFDIALALGFWPVGSANAGYDGAETAPYHDAYLASWQGEKTQFFTFQSGTPFEFIATLDPDLILATGAWSLDADYDRLSSIAPVVAFEGEREAVSSWQEKTLTVGRALAREAEAEALVAAVKARFAEAAATHPQFAGRTAAYGVVHPEQLTYISVAGDTSTTFFELLGFVQPPAAAQFTAESSAVSRERLDLFDADLLLFGFPFEGEATVSRAELEADSLFRRLRAVADGHYVVVPQPVASSLAYPSPLSTVWVLDQMLPLIEKALP